MQRTSVAVCARQTRFALTPAGRRFCTERLRIASTMRSSLGSRASKFGSGCIWPGLAGIAGPVGVPVWPGVVVGDVIGVVTGVVVGVGVVVGIVAGVVAGVVVGVVVGI